MFKLDFWSRFKRFLAHRNNHPRKNQSFNFSWEIEVFNVSQKSAAGELFLPIPPELSRQKIIRAPIFTPIADNIATEETYRNRYASWKVALDPGEKKSFFCQFQAETHPVNFLPKNKFSLSDYEKNELPKENFLSANRFLRLENPEIKKIAEDIAGEEKDVLLILKKINAYVYTRLKYGKPIWGLYSATDALEKEVVDCGGFASLLVSLCLFLGIPARIVSGFWAGYADNAMHVWAEIQLPDGVWLPADPTVENLKALGRTQKIGQLGFVGSDRIIFSYGCDLEINTSEGKIKIDILQNPFISGADEKKIKIKHNLKTESLNL